MDAPTFIDPLPLAQALIRRPSVTPAEEGALDVAENALKAMGFRVRRLKFGLVDNLYARLGDAQPNFCFAGHVDVVPPGQGWPATAKLLPAGLWIVSPEVSFCCPLFSLCAC